MRKTSTPEQIHDNRKNDWNGIGDHVRIFSIECFHGPSQSDFSEKLVNADFHE